RPGYAARAARRGRTRLRAVPDRQRRRSRARRRPRRVHRRWPPLGPAAVSVPGEVPALAPRSARGARARRPACGRRASARDRLRAALRREDGVMARRTDVYRVHGMMQSYFTRKMTGYLDYKRIPWLFRRFPGVSAESMAAGFPGGVPVVETPAGEFMWDSTSMIHHLEIRFPEPAVLPPDPVQRFLCYVLEDAADEWLYRPAVGTRWHFPENAAVGGFELARDIAVRMPVSCEQAHAAVGAHVLSSCAPLGATADTIQSWVDDVLRPWMRVLGTHLARRPYLLGERPSLADFALFGGNAAHFINDPLCRRWVEEDGPAVVQHTHRLLEPEDQDFGAWDDAAEVSE